MVKPKQRRKVPPLPPSPRREPIVLKGVLGATLDRAAASLREQDDAGPVTAPPVPEALPTRGEHLVRLEQLVRDRAAVDREITAVLRSGRSAGLSFAELGRALGVTRQAARLRAGSPALGDPS